FFFSSRRRHTRFSRDWSSDVCSSDLFVFWRPSRVHEQLWGARFNLRASEERSRLDFIIDRFSTVASAALLACRVCLVPVDGAIRSEERRVGEGGRGGRAG